MNSITQALKTAGAVIPPVNKRIWLWIKDHPGKTSTDVSKAIGVPANTAASSLGQMTKRKMLTCTQSVFHDKPRLVYTACIREYELLPLPKAKRVPATVEATPRPAPAPTPPTPKPLMEVLENYTLKELRVVRDGLNHLFEYV